jgi:hypothetical protein
MKHIVDEAYVGDYFDDDDDDDDHDDDDISILNKINEDDSCSVSNDVFTYDIDDAENRIVLPLLQFHFTHDCQIILFFNLSILNQFHGVAVAVV